jgi:hypothetical protein
VFVNFGYDGLIDDLFAVVVGWQLERLLLMLLHLINL